MSAIDPRQFANTLEKVAHTTAQQEFALPSLAKDDIPWFSFLNEWILKALKALAKLTENWRFPDWARNIDLKVWVDLIWVFLLISAGVAIVVILWKLLAWLSDFSDGTQSQRADQVQTADISLLTELARCEENREYAKAARLRWRIFLIRIGQPASQTVQEVLVEAKHAELLNQTYRLMFDTLESEEEHYQRWTSLLGSWEIATK